ncbi:unnamed protein product [Mycena citricolor]|uniref:Uncharacterized protein n=1 Tax=Mycena citricolor TaxID=2018698 RepID=A0AAD2Q477_9AGAR|nr:unnamed protein product [Mycena citricolor]
MSSLRSSGQTIFAYNRYPPITARALTCESSDPIFIRPQKTARTTFSAIKLYGLLSYSLVTTILWWHSFIVLIRDQAGSHALLSPVAVLTVIGYLVTLERDIPARLYTPLSWVLTPAALGQFGASIAALVFFYRAHAHSPQYTVLPSFDVSDYRCDVRAMLFNPTNTTYLVSLGASPILLAFALLPLALILFTCYESNLRGLGIGLAYIYILLALF